MEPKRLHSGGILENDATWRVDSATVGAELRTMKGLQGCVILAPLFLSVYTPLNRRNDVLSDIFTMYIWNGL